MDSVNPDDLNFGKRNVFMDRVDPDQTAPAMRSSLI